MNSASSCYKENNFSLKRRVVEGLLQYLYCQYPSWMTLAIPRASTSISPDHPELMFWEGVWGSPRDHFGMEDLTLPHLLTEKHIKTQIHLPAPTWLFPTYSPNPPNTHQSKSRSWPLCYSSCLTQLSRLTSNNLTFAILAPLWHFPHPWRLPDQDPACLIKCCLESAESL